MKNCLTKKIVRTYGMVRTWFVMGLVLDAISIEVEMYKQYLLDYYIREEFNL